MPISIKDLLRQHASSPAIARNVQVARVLRTFSDVVTDFFPTHQMEKIAKAAFLRNRVLGIWVKSPVVSQELRFKEKEIVAAINEKCGRDMIGGLLYIVK